MTKLRDLREELGYNKKQMAAALEMPYTTYVSYEKGERGLSSETLKRLSNFFGVSTDYILGRTENREKDLTPPGVENDDNLALREMLRTRPDVKILFDASKDAPTSAILEAAALIMRYKEESERE